MNHRMANGAKNTAAPYPPNSHLHNKTTPPQGQGYGQSQGQGQNQGTLTYGLCISETYNNCVNKTSLSIHCLTIHPIAYHINY